MKMLSVRQKAILGAFIVTFLVGASFGGFMKPTITRTVTVTKVEHKTKVIHTKPKVTYKFPKVCFQAMSLAEDIHRAAEAYDVTSTSQTDIAMAARMAIANADLIKLGKVLTRQNNLDNQTVGYTLQLSGTIDEYKDAARLCKEATK